MADPASETLRGELLRCLAMARVSTARLLWMRWQMVLVDGTLDMRSEQRYLVAGGRSVVIEAAEHFGVPGGKITQVCQPSSGSVTYRDGRLEFTPGEAGETEVGFTISAGGETHAGRAVIQVVDRLPPIQWTTSGAMVLGTPDEDSDVLPIHGGHR